MRYVLIHGAYHGSWCWDRLRPELERRGHEVIAPDLPIEDPHAGAAAYASAVLDMIPTAPAPTVLVGHSLAGLTVPVVASRLTTRHMVFLCALLPVPGSSFDGLNVDFGTGFQPSASPFEQPDGSSRWPEAGAVEMFYQHCEPTLAAWAATRLRGQHWAIMQEVTPLDRWPDISASYVLAREDRAVAPEYSRTVAQALLGVEPIEIDGDHSPFLSCPEELAEILSRIGHNAAHG